MRTTVDDQVRKIYLFEISGICLEFIWIFWNFLEFSSIYLGFPVFIKFFWDFSVFMAPKSCLHKPSNFPKKENFIIFF
jgi:hypothetical protein